MTGTGLYSSSISWNHCLNIKNTYNTSSVVVNKAPGNFSPSDFTPLITGIANNS